MATTKVEFDIFARDKASPVFDKLGRKLKQTETSTLDLSSAFKTVATSVALIKLGGIVKDSIELEAAYSKTMRQVQVQTKSSGAAMRGLDDLALKMGADTVFSAQDASGAMLALAKGGLKEAQIQAGALSSTMTLAAAGSIDLTEAGDITVNTMGAFGLAAKDTDTAVAALAGAANATSAEVNDMAQALAQSGAQAHASGLSVQETTALLAAFAGAGIKGSDAGTSLKTMLQRLVPATTAQKNAMADLNLSFTDANGNFVGAEQIAGRLQKAFHGMSQADKQAALTRIFGSDASRAANILLLQGESGIRKYIKATSDQTAAEKLAKTTMEGTSGAIEDMMGSVETAQIRLGKGLAPVVEDVAGKLSDFVSDAPIEDWAREAAEGIQAFGDATLPIARNVLPPLIEAGGLTLEVLEQISPIVIEVAEAFGTLPSAVQQAVILGVAVSNLGTRFQGFRASSSDALLNLRTMPDAMRNAAIKSAAFRVGIGAAGIGLAAFSTKLGESNQSLGNVASVLGSAATGFAVGGPWGAAVGGGVAILQAFRNESKATSEEIAAMATAFDEATGKMIASVANQGVIKDLSAGPLVAGGDITALQGAKAIGIDLRVLTDAALGSSDALDKVRGRLSEIANLSPEQFKAAAEQMGIGVGDLADIQVGLGGLLDENADKWRQAGENARLVAEAMSGPIKSVKQFRQAVSDLPPAVITELETTGFRSSSLKVDLLTRKYNLTPAQVQTVFAALDRATPLAKKVEDRLKDLDRTKANPQVNIAGNALGQAQAIGQAIRDIHGKTVGIKVVGGTTLAYAGGTSYHPGGSAVVGEEGPEIVDLPVGSRVHTASASRATLRAGTSGGKASGSAGLTEAGITRAIMQGLSGARFVMDGKGNVRLAGLGA